MPASNVCWGIEVGAGNISAIKLEAAGDSINVLDFAVLPHKRPLSAPDTDPDDVVRLALGAFVNQYDLSGATVAVSIPGHAAFARFAKLPPVEPKKVPDIVKFEAQQQIPFPLEQVEWDYQTFVSPDSPEIEVGIFAVTKDRVNQRLLMYQDVNLVPNIVTLGPVSAYNALAFDLAFDSKTPGTIIIDIGNTSTDLIVCEPGRAWIRTFPIGGHHFTEAIMQEFSLGYLKAEKLKREAESPKHVQHVLKAMRPVFDDIAQEIQRSLGYYRTLHPDAQLQRVIGVGSTFNIPGLRRFLKQQLELNIYKIEDFKRINVEGAREEEFKNSAINLVTAYGLALQGLGRAALVANLMPVVIARDAMWKRKNVWFGAAAGLAVAASAAMFLRPFMDDQAIRANRPPPTIQDAVNHANSVKTSAQQVASGGGTDLRAANLVASVKSEAIMRHVLSDFDAMMQTAQAWAKSNSVEHAGPPFLLREMMVEYIAPVEVKPDFSGLGPIDPKQPEAAFEVTMKVVTNARDAQRLLINTVDAWLQQRAKLDANTETRRAGVPYIVEVPVAPARTWEAEVSRFEQENPIVAPPGQEASRIVAGRPTGPGRTTAPPPTPTGATMTEGGAAPSASSAGLDTSAPIPPQPRVEGPGSDATYIVKWRLVLPGRTVNGGI